MAVLRHAENALVREMTVQVMSQAISTNPKGLGSGTRNLLSDFFWPRNLETSLIAVSI